MLADIILNSSGLHTLSLANNALDDAAVVQIMEAIKANDVIHLQFLDLSGNLICQQVSYLLIVDGLLLGL